MASNKEILVFYCRNLCGGEEIVGFLRHSEVALDGVEIEPLPCSGKIDPRYLMKAFEAGAKRVCVVTCPLNKCKLIEGNLRAVRRVEAVKELMAEAGLNPDCLQLFRPSGPGEEMLKETFKNVSEFMSNKIKLEVDAG